jgi:hypothetical protein
MRSIYIERMDNALSEKLILSLGKMGRFKIAATSKEADAIMTGSCLESRRLKRLHSEVFIADRAGQHLPAFQPAVARPGRQRNRAGGGGPPGRESQRSRNKVSGRITARCGA